MEHLLATTGILNQKGGFPFTMVFVAIAISGLIYLLWGKNTKQMIHLYPEEKKKPVLSRMRLRAYRILILIIIPGIPVYFLTLKLIGAIHWSWIWVLLPTIIILGMPYLLVFIGAANRMREEKGDDNAVAL